MKLALLYPLPGAARLQRPASGSERPVERMPTLSLYLLAAVLRQRGHEVTLNDLPGDTQDPGRLAAIIQGMDAVGVSANSFSWAAALSTVHGIRAAFPEMPVILGGIHPTYFDQHCLEVSGGMLEAPGATYIVRGEGERTLPALLEALQEGREPADVPGLTYAHRGGGVTRTSTPPPLGPGDLDELPPPAYDLIPALAYRAAPIQTSRGCLYACAFCSIPHRRLWRPLRPERCLELVETALAQAGRFASPGAVYFLDDCFTTDGPRAERVLRELDRRGLGRDSDPGGTKLSLGLEARADHLTEPLVSALARLPLWLIQIGVECGYPQGLRRVGKGVTLSEVEAAAALLKEHGVIEQAVFSFIIGLPWETLEDCVATLTYALRLALGYGAPLSLSWYEPFPGSRIWSKRGDYGVSLGPAVFDGPGDWRTDPELFKAFRPRLTWDDCRKIEDLVHDLAAIVPRHLALFQSRAVGPAAPRP
jgi:anaerobic magnesium-protoporphyrin IX monomethyl ester cyclase